jgi:hypothetical protein
VNQLEPPRGDLAEINVVVVFTGGCQERDHLPPVSPVIVVGESISV